MNKADSERIATVLEEKNYRPAQNMKQADLIVVNMCSVRQSAVDRVYGLAQKIKKIRKTNPNLKTILTGCVLKEDKKKFSKDFDLILNIKDLPNWPQILHNKTMLQNIPWYNYSHSFYFKIPPKNKTNTNITNITNIFNRANTQSNTLKNRINTQTYIPISTGCNNFCTYCVVPFTRGPLVCRDYKEILEEAKKAIKDGFKEIWLLGQNVNDYTFPNNPQMEPNEPQTLEKYSRKLKKNSEKNIVNFSKLIKMVNDIPGDFKFFFTSPHPKNFSDELIDTLAKCEKFSKVLNLPVQSGDNEILKRMNRNYTVEEYKNLVKKIRRKMPDIKLSTDIIVGFPGETEEQFQNTVKIFKEIHFDWAYISKYSPRPGTPAYLMEDNVPLQEKKRREKILRKILTQ